MIKYYIDQQKNEKFQVIDEDRPDIEFRTLQDFDKNDDKTLKGKPVINIDPKNAITDTLHEDENVIKFVYIFIINY